MLEALRPAVIFSNGIGDHVLNLPALRALSAVFPERLTLICESWSKEIFFNRLSLLRVCEVDMQETNGGRRFDAETVARNIEGCDLLLSLNPWHSDSVERLIELASPVQSVGFFSPFHTILPLDFDKHSADLAFDVVRFLDSSLRLEDFAAPPLFPRRFIEGARRIRKSMPSNMRVLAVHADTSGEKMWSCNKLINLLDDFLSNHPDFLVLVVGKKELQLDTGRLGHRVVPCYGLAFPVSATLVAEADLFLGIDSCMLHVADIFRVPGVGLFGPTSSHEWGFRFGLGRHVCAEGSMDGIQGAEVLRALESVLSETSSSELPGIALESAR